MTQNGQWVADLLSLAGMAPFHRACDEIHRTHGGGPAGSQLKGIEPWRFHALDARACRRLKSLVPSENAGKIPAMLAACDVLILATWLPNPASADYQSNVQMSAVEANGDAVHFEPTLANMEHIAAVASAIQNLLLAATARGVPNYWSSGGVLRSAEVFDILGIPSEQVLLGAVFLFPSQSDCSEPESCEVVESKLRPHRTGSSCWSRWVTL